MNTIQSMKGIVLWLNQPIVKQTAKDLLGYTTFFFGVLELGEETLLGARHLHSRFKDPQPRKIDSYKMIVAFARLSVVLSARAF